MQIITMAVSICVSSLAIMLNATVLLDLPYHLTVLLVSVSRILFCMHQIQVNDLTKDAKRSFFAIAIAFCLFALNIET